MIYCAERADHPPGGIGQRNPGVRDHRKIADGQIGRYQRIEARIARLVAQLQGQERPAFMVAGDAPGMAGFQANHWMGLLGPANLSPESQRTSGISASLDAAT